MFEEMKEKGTLKKKHRGKEIYGITKYGELDNLLGRKWFIRGLNENGDFCYAILKTVSFYLKRRINIVDFKPSEKHGSIRKFLYSHGRSLVFTFVRADGFYFSILFSLNHDIINIKSQYQFRLCICMHVMRVLVHAD